MILKIITMTIQTSSTKGSSNPGPSIGEDQAMRVTTISIEIGIKAATITDTGEDAMKEVAADLKKHLAASRIKETTQCKIVNNLPLLHHTAVKCTGNRISKECNKVLCSRNKSGRWLKVKTLISSSNR